MAVHIVTDSTACLPEGYASEHDVTVVPLKVTLDGVTYRDGVDITGNQFYKALEAGQAASTSQPSPEQFKQAYQGIMDKDPDADILSIHVTSKISGTLNSALTARNLLNTTRIRFIDSLSAGLGMGFPVMRAAKLAATGALASAVAEATEAMCKRTHCYYVLESLKYLERGGRIGKAKAILASILKIKPLLTFTEGAIDVIAQPRTKRVALERLWSVIETAVHKGVEDIGFHYGTNLLEVEEFQREFARRFNLSSFLTQLSPVVGTYSGPDMIGCCLVETLS
jgi:DegV family protein with EDD domain